MHMAWRRANASLEEDPEDGDKMAEAASAKARYDQAVTTTAVAIKAEKAKKFQAHVLDVVEMADKSRLRRMWQWISTIMDGKRGLIASPIQDAAGVLVMDPEGIGDAWADHFEALAKDSDTSSTSTAYWEKLVPRATDQEKLEDLNDDISWKELQECLSSMGREKAPGESGIPVEWIMMAVENETESEAAVPTTELGRVVLALVRGMFDKACIPRCLRTSLLVPIPKKGDMTLPDNYRGISLMESVLKVACTVVNRRLVAALEESERLCKEQAGFRKREEGMAQVSSLFEVCARRQATNLPTFLLFVDFAKAYDTVPHAGVLRKLENIGVHGKMLSFIKVLLETSSFRVRTPGALSRVVSLARGLPQGNAISCVAFDVFINDIGNASIADRISIPDVTEKIGELAFADDLVIFAESKEQLARRASKLTKWAKDNKMSFGIKKCGVMVHNLPEAKWQHLDISLGGEKVPVVKEYTYLGVLVSHDMCLKKLVHARVKASMGALARLRPCLSTRSIPMHIRLRVLQSMLAPVINYAGEMFGFNEVLAKPLQSVMNRGLRLVMGVKETSKGCQPAVLFRQCDVAPVFVSASALRLRALIKFPSLRTWARILSLKETKAPNSWHRKGQHYMKLECGGKCVAQLPEKEQVKALKVHLWWRMDQRNAVRSSQCWIEYGMWRKTSAFVKKVSYNPLVIRGTPLLAAMRTGAYWTAERAARAKLIDYRWRSECPCCKKNVPETTMHVLLKCKRWADERKKMTNKINEALRREKICISWRKRSSFERMTLLLGGTVVGFDLSSLWENGPSTSATKTASPSRPLCDRSAPLFFHAAEYLARIQVERSKCIWVHSNIPALNQSFPSTVTLSTDLGTDASTSEAAAEDPRPSTRTTWA